jgi:hypothetical protein
MAEFESQNALLSQLGSFTPKTINGLCKVSLEFLEAPSSFNLTDQLSDYASATGLALLDLQNASKVLMVVYQRAMVENWTETQFSDMLGSLGVASEIIQIIIKNWSKKSNSLILSVGDRTIATNDLVDMDWSFGVTSASSDSHHVGKTYLQMRLTIKKDSNSNKNNNDTDAHVDTDSGTCDIFLELTIEEFYHFLAQLEACKSCIDVLSS